MKIKKTVGFASEGDLSKEDEALVRDAESLLDDARMKLFLVDKQD